MICTCLDKGVSASVPPVCQEVCCSIGRGLRMRNACRAARRNSIPCALHLRAFRLTKSITQSCGACASHPHNTHCFCLPPLDGPNTHLLISGRNACTHGCLFHMCSTFELSSVRSSKRSSEVRHDLLVQSPPVSTKNRQDLKSLHLKQTVFQGPVKAGMNFSSLIKLCPGASLCLERH